MNECKYFDRSGLVRRLFTEGEAVKALAGFFANPNPDKVLLSLPMRFGNPQNLVKIIESFGGQKCALLVEGKAFAISNNEVYLFGETNSHVVIGGLRPTDFSLA